MQKLLIIVMLSVLSGCASYNSSFECNPGKGLQCTSISKINNMVDSGVLNDGSTTEQNKKIKKEIIKVKNKTLDPMVLSDNLHNSIVHRLPETTLRIWVAPYVSATDGYIEAQYVHEVLEPGSWLEYRG